MSEPNDNDAFAQKAKDLFDDSVEKLDGASLSRLNRGRHVALEELGARPLRARWSTWVPVGGIAAAAVVSVMVMQTPETVIAPQTAVTDFELLLDGEEFELIENLEFYNWLDESELGAMSDLG